MFVAGEWGAVIVGLYLLATFGIGLRYGRLYMALTAFLSMIGFTLVIYTAPWWQSHAATAEGWVLALAILPMYVSILTKQPSGVTRPSELTRP